MPLFYQTFYRTNPLFSLAVCCEVKHGKIPLVWGRVQETGVQTSCASPSLVAAVLYSALSLCTQDPTVNPALKCVVGFSNLIVQSFCHCFSLGSNNETPGFQDNWSTCFGVHYLSSRPYQSNSSNFLCNSSVESFKTHQVLI